MSCVLVTRPEEAARRTAAHVRAAGHDVLLAPVLRLEARDSPVPDLDGSSWQAVLVTSRHAATAAARFPKGVPIFAVGEGTSTALERSGIVPQGIAHGDGRALGQLVGKRLDPGRGALLHPTGTVRAPALEDALVAGDFDYRPWVVYAAEPVVALAPEATAALDSGKVDAVTLYSPRSARLFLALLGDTGLEGTLSRVVALTLSAKVAAAASSADWREIRVAPQPDEQGMAGLLEELEH